ncbi:MAG: EF-hand domain-containing protein [Chitinophagaceae bacterium]|nr:EF-hand domain-containing protein [Chitinophagaceae bacterium]
MIKRSIIICMLVTGFATVSSYAQERKEPPRRDPEELFKKLDTDGDGKISKDEADKAEHKMIKDHFSEMDTNADDYISKEEFKAFKPKGSPRKKG